MTRATSRPLLSRVLLGAALCCSLLACTAILGSFEVASSSVDASTPDASPVDGAPTDAAADAPDALGDAGAADVAVDAQPPVQPCAVSDAGTLVYPGDPCNFSSDGTPVPAQGACRPGKWACIDVGGGERFGQCLGAVAPVVESCVALPDGTGADENCDGTVDENCPCVSGTKRSCGVGTCVGEQLCTSGKWGTCAGPAPGARVCASALDNDCNGKPDRDEDFCRCQGPAGASSAIGDAVPCSAFGSTGKCTDVPRRCLASGVSFAAWNINCRSGIKNCLDNADNDCDGTQDWKENECFACILNGNRFAAEEQLGFTGTSPNRKGVLGCAGTAANRSAAAALCIPGTTKFKCQLCTAEQWKGLPLDRQARQNYWLADDLEDTVGIGGCNLESPGFVPSVCAAGRVCGTVASEPCAERGCSVRGGAIYQGLGCGAPLAKQPSGGAMCCCQ